MAHLSASLTGNLAFVVGLPVASRLWASPQPVASSRRLLGGTGVSRLTGGDTVPVAVPGVVRAAWFAPSASAASSAPVSTVSSPSPDQTTHAALSTGIPATDADSVPATTATPASSGNGPPTVLVPADHLRTTCTTILERAGYPSGQVAMMVDVFLYGQLSGSSQSVAKLVSRGVGSLAGPTRRRSPTSAADDGSATDEDGTDGEPAEPVEVVSTAVAARLDATGVPGMVAMTIAADSAVARARTAGIGLVATAGSVDGTGAIGYYARRVASAGFFCLAASGASPPLVAPVGASVPLIGTNPLAFGIPYGVNGSRSGDNANGGDGGDGDATTGVVVADIGTSAMSYWEVARMADDAPLPAGVALTAEGAEAATAAAAAVLRPFGGSRDEHKGSALGLLVEWLTGPLVGATVVGGGSESSSMAGSSTHGNGDEPAGWGNFVLAIDPGLLRSRAAVLGETARWVAALQEEGVVLPGEGGASRRAVAKARGVPVEAAVWDQLQALAA